MTVRIGFIGLGVMGTPMAVHLFKAGYGLTVLDVDPAKTDALVASSPGIAPAASPREVAAASDIVITMLPSGEYVRDVTLGADGLVEGFSGGELLLDTSSSEPWFTLETAEKLEASGVSMVDAPVSG